MLLVANRRTVILWDPFGYNVKLVTKIEVRDCCGIVYKAIYRDWTKGDYTNKEVTVKCGGVECKGVIAGSYVERKKSKKELEYEQLCKKWR